MTDSKSISFKPAAALIVGGGIAGTRAALDLADAGLKVYLVEQSPCLGGRVAQLGFMFPQHDCVLCRGTPDHGYGCTRPTISPAYVDHNQHPNIEVLTNTHVVDVEGQAGDFTVTLRQEPRYVDPHLCIDCGLCAAVCPVELPSEYQWGLARRKAAYKVAPRSAPNAYVIDRGPYCDGCSLCVKACPTKAIDLEELARLRTIAVGAIVLAIGFSLFDASGLEELGYRRYPNVIDAMQYERLASRSGPTEGLIMRPSDGATPRSVAWLQCVGSRDQQNSFCSSICCMYATKEAILAKQRLAGEVECSIFIMDERAFNKEYSTYFAKARQQHGIRYLRCRVSNIQEDPLSHDLILHYADPDGALHQERFELVILSIGLQPANSARHLAQILNIELNEFGFCETDKFTPLQTSHSGVFVCGAFSSPKEISETILDASGAAAEVMRLLNERLNTYPYSREWPFLAGESFPPERDVSREAPRTGVFVCSCGDTLKTALNLRELAGEARQMPGVVFATVKNLACFPEQLSELQETIVRENLNRVVVAACSNRTHESLFQRAVRQAGLNPYLLELVNLRDHCWRVHRDQPALAGAKARELVRMAVARAALAEPVHKEKHHCIPAALVIGGGVAGLTAALTIADAGYEVHLVERSPVLGGNIYNMFYVAEGYNPQRLARDLVNRVRSHQRIRTYVNSEVVHHTGHVGDFRARLRTSYPNPSLRSGRTSREPEYFEVRHGVTIVATGAVETQDHPWLQHPRIITQRELEEWIVHKPQEIAALQEVVMIQCVRPEGMKEYCSRVCCTNTLKNAIRLKLSNPERRVIVLYKDIVTYGFRESFYTEARRLGVLFIRYDDENRPVVDTSHERPGIRVRDPSLGRWLALKPDLVTLSMAIAPSAGTEALAAMLRVPLSSEGFFQEAQMKLRPMDFQREGIFLAGMAAYPKFIEESISHALAAAARAITLLAQESLYLGGVVAEVDPDKCVGCLTCTRTCPFGIPVVLSPAGALEAGIAGASSEAILTAIPTRHRDPHMGRTGVGGLGGAAFIDPAQCQGCGTCTGECPANAIQLVHYRDEQIMLRSTNGLGSWLPASSVEAI